MTREEIIGLAREAGFGVTWPESTFDFTRAVYASDEITDEMERFAALVAAAEREACAEICACEAKRWGESPKLTLSVAEHWMKGYEEGANSCAAKIRARGQE